MKLLHLLAALAVGMAASVHAADTPGASPAPSAGPPSAAERLASARRMIELQDFRRAERELAAALRDQPDNADAHNLLGYAYRKRPSPDLGKAFEHYQAALRLDPQHKGAHEYIGEAYLLDRKPDQAEKHLAQLEQICGNRSCEEYQDLAKAIAAYKSRQ